MPRGVYSRKNPGKRKASTVTLNDESSESFQPTDRQQQGCYHRIQPSQCTKETTENIALDIGNRVQSPFYFPEWASRRIAIAVFDNCLVKFDTSYDGVRAADRWVKTILIHKLAFIIHSLGRRTNNN